MAAKHTPGTWTNHFMPLDEGMRHRIKAQGGRTICLIPESGRRNADADMANANLIAAAPELLAACETLMLAEAVQDGERNGATLGLVSRAIDAARAAICKASGQ